MDFLLAVALCATRTQQLTVGNDGSCTELYSVSSAETDHNNSTIEHSHHWSQS